MSTRSKIWSVCVLAAIAGITVGCNDREKKRPSTTQPITRYQSLGPRSVPDYLKGTLYEISNMQDMAPFPVSGYALVGQLRGTGDNSAIPTAVREYMRKELARHGYGTFRNPVTPEQVLRDPTFAVVRVDGLIPPGARKEDHFDILVSVPEESYTSSLSHGVLYRAGLKYMGADPQRPGGSVNVYANVQGPIFVNPEYALLSKKQIDANARKSLRYGIVMDGGMAIYDSPLALRVRDPQFAVTRAIEHRINQRFQEYADKTNKVGVLAMAQAQDDAIVHVYVPRLYRGDYEHFAGVVKHLYANPNPGFLATMAEKLAEAAEQPDAPLENISYAWEGIGEPAQQVLAKAMKSSKPEVAFAAARAAAFIGDDLEEARTVLVAMAKTPDHPYRLNAVKTLGQLPASSDTNQYLRQLIDADSTPVRIEAYKALVRNNDQRVYSNVVQEKFVLDMVPSSGPPLIYATRRGIPRLAVFGMRQAITTPVTFAAIDSRLTLSADAAGGPVTLFYRADKTLGDRSTTAIKQTSRADLADIIARLGGNATEGETAMDFSYADVVAIVQSMHQSGKVVAQSLDGKQLPITLVIEEETGLNAGETLDAPQIPDSGRQLSESEDLAAPAIPDADGSAVDDGGQELPAEEPADKPAAGAGRAN